MAPSSARFMRRYVNPRSPFLVNSVPSPLVLCFFVEPSFEKPMNMVMPAVTMNTTRYL